MAETINYKKGNKRQLRKRQTPRDHDQRFREGFCHHTIAALQNMPKVKKRREKAQEKRRYRTESSRRQKKPTREQNGKGPLDGPAALVRGTAQLNYSEVRPGEAGGLHRALSAGFMQGSCPL